MSAMVNIAVRRLFLAFFLLIIGIIYLRNTAIYNSYWAYDGGAHINYILTIAHDNRLPTMTENYLAWHEPLYYLASGLLVKIFFWLGISELVAMKILQFVNAFWGLSFVIGSGLLAWLVTRNKFISFVVLFLVGILPELSESSRFISNEVVFQSLALWWLVLFFYWQMNELEKWTIKKWSILVIGLAILLWVKITALILVLALFLWLVFLAFREKKVKIVLLGLGVLLIISLAFSPWLWHKQKTFSTALTINNFELNLENKRMKKVFYFSLDKGIMVNPFWPAGTKSFWSMFYADTLGDYYNIFQNYEENNLTYKTVNNRMVTIHYASSVLALYWFSLPLYTILLIGFFLELFCQFKNKENKRIFLFLVFGGFLLALVYNTYKYPFLDRGTMKVIFIILAYPIFYILSILGLKKIKKYLPYFLKIALVVYLLILGILSLNSIILWS